ncbi:hypothetical protein GQ53DRAFT_776955 [Thozetella sp. PMI_491]|nr:hypothetical protein GQ53DRAFT_776955 [Thozetella sp. PMI_491]
MQKAALLLCFLSLVWLVSAGPLGASDLVGRTGSAAFDFAHATLAPGEQRAWVGGGAASLYKAQPDAIRISFEEAVRDVELAGWEEEWFSSGVYDVEKYGALAEPKLDFVYNWVNGSDEAFQEARRPYELQSPLNDAKGEWLARHAVNRYRDWDELRYSLRSLDAYARGIVNRVQVLVNSVADSTGALVPQRPAWLRHTDEADNLVQVLGQESFFGEDEQQCLPTFNSLAIEAQLHRTPSERDQLVALSDDMFLGAPHVAADFYSPLFGPAMAFKPDHYNVQSLGGKDKWPSFGEKPFLYYTSHLLNRRFGSRNRHVQAHFGHSVSRSVMKEALASFPQPYAQGSCERFRGESNFQIYPWYASFHYTIERFREVLLWSFIVARSDGDGDGYLDWAERQAILDAAEPGWRALGGQDSSMPARQSRVRDRMYYRLPDELRRAGLQPPEANVNVLWTSLDGPATIRGVKCHHFSVDECFGESFGSPLSDAAAHDPGFTASNVFARLAVQRPECGDCLLKFLLEGAPRGLEPLLPPAVTRAADRTIVVKALKKYQHTIVGTDAMKFVMVKDAEQAQAELLERAVLRGEKFGQWCLNDDVMDEAEESQVRAVISEVFQKLWPKRGRWERED